MSSIVRAVSRSLRAVLEANGYWVRKRAVLPYGIDYQHDIDRLSKIFGTTVNVFFDIGANTGQTAAAALKNFPAAEVYAFEPHEPSFLALKNGISNPRCKPFNLALSDKSGQASFFAYGNTALCNSLVEDSQYAAHSHHPAKVVTVECETLDNFCKTQGVERIDVLKVDTEGHDLAVLRGAEKVLNEHRVRFLYIEFNTMQPKEGTTGGALMPISAVLEPLGFRFVASYPELMLTEGDFFVTSNALFVRPPSAE